MEKLLLICPCSFFMAHCVQVYKKARPWPKLGLTLLPHAGSLPHRFASTSIGNRHYARRRELHNQLLYINQPINQYVYFTMQLRNVRKYSSNAACEKGKIGPIDTYMYIIPILGYLMTEACNAHNFNTKRKSRTNNNII